MILLNGLITNDKFCMIRPSQLKLRWSRRLSQTHLRQSDYASAETSQQGATYETSVESPSTVSGGGRRSKTLGSSLSEPPTVEPVKRDRRPSSKPISPTPIGDQS